MKKLLLALFAFIALDLFSQTNDTIILNTGEIIPCDILDVSKSGLVTYEYITGNGERGMAQKGDALIKEIKYATQNLNDSLSQQVNLIIPDTTGTVSLLLSDAMKQIEKARKLTQAGIVFGTTANTCVLLNTTILADNNIETWQGVTHIVGLSTSITRGFLSFATPNHLKKATNKLLMVRDISGDTTLFNYSIGHLKTARKAAIAVPILGVVGWNLIHVGVLGIESGTGIYNFLYITGWACAAASLTCTFISGSHISRAKKSLQENTGTLNLGMNKFGLGISYRF